MNLCEDDALIRCALRYNLEEGNIVLDMETIYNTYVRAKTLLPDCIN